ncbi:MAG: hypothetical protein ACPIOQ_35820, partial [Promethearchaeia archaeon]
KALTRTAQTGGTPDVDACSTASTKLGQGAQISRSNLFLSHLVFQAHLVHEHVCTGGAFSRGGLPAASSGEANVLEILCEMIESRGSF